MKTTNVNSRRKFLKQGFRYISMVAVGGTVLAACNGGDTPKEQKPDVSTSEKPPVQKAVSADPCDIASLTEQDIKNRKALGYVEHTPIPEKTCDGCKLFVPANDTVKCGTCSLFKGPIEIEGYCTYWADKSA